MVWHVIGSFRFYFWLIEIETMHGFLANPTKIDL